LRILQFVVLPNWVEESFAKKNWAKVRDGEKMIDKMLKTLAETSREIVVLGVDCTPYPGGDISIPLSDSSRDEYGSKPEFIPRGEKESPAGNCQVSSSRN